MKDILDFEKRYAIYEDGRVWSYPKGSSSRNGRWLKPALGGPTGSQYLFVVLYKAKSKRGVIKKIHRLVAEHFLTNVNNYSEVNHLNGNKLDNRVGNLEWCSRKQNVQHAWDTGLNRSGDIKGELNPNSKMRVGTVLRIRDLKSKGLRQIDIARELGITSNMVLKVLTGKTWKHV